MKEFPVDMTWYYVDNNDNSQYRVTFTDNTEHYCSLSLIIIDQRVPRKFFIKSFDLSNVQYKLRILKMIILNEKTIPNQKSGLDIPINKN